MPEDAAAQPAKADSMGQEGTEYVPSQQRPEEGAPPPPKRQQQPNPYNAMGSALDHFHKQAC